MSLPRFRPSPVLVCLLAAVLALIVARDLAARHLSLPVVTACAIATFLGIHHSLLPFTRRPEGTPTHG